MTNALIQNYDGHVAYYTSKMYNMWFSLAFARLLSGQWLPQGDPSKTLLQSCNRMCSISLIPGFIPSTGLFRQLPGPMRFLFANVMTWFPFTTTVEDAASRIAFASFSTIASDAVVTGPPPRVLASPELKPHARDEQRAWELWNDSCAHLGLEDWKLVKGLS
jgi:hypothetical protein